MQFKDVFDVCEREDHGLETWTGRIVGSLLSYSGKHFSLIDLYDWDVEVLTPVDHKKGHRAYRKSCKIRQRILLHLELLCAPAS